MKRRSPSALFIQFKYSLPRGAGASEEVHHDVIVTSGNSQQSFDQRCWLRIVEHLLTQEVAQFLCRFLIKARIKESDLRFLTIFLPGFES